MYTFLLVCHVVIAVMIVGAVLMQSGKGGGLGAGFGGGGANTLFGSSGGGNFFTKLTMGLAAAFMVTSIALTATKSRQLKTSIFDQNKASTSAPSAPAGAAAPAAGENSAPATAAPSTGSTPAAPAGSESPKSAN
jgi:preprotein translocase subunit SecG